ncbi:MAG: hypothetical protein ABFS35_22770, partial [Bacteroidota bacterium]
SESIIISNNKEPASMKLNIGDVIYVSESGIGIYAKGVVKNNNEMFTISDTIDEIVKNHDIKKEGKYWADKLSRFHEEKIKNNKVKFKYHRYIIDQKLLKTVIPFKSKNLEKFIKPGFESSFIKLTHEDVESIENPIIIPDITFKSEIPSTLKFKIHSLVNRNDTSNYWYDIDHLVPKSVGGPGNIIENLAPIGFSLNRYKNNSIPIEFLLVSKKLLGWRFDGEIEEIITNNNQNLVKLNSSKNLYTHCTQINEKVQSKDFEEAKKFYFEVLRLKYPELSKIYKKHSTPVLI